MSGPGALRTKRWIVPVFLTLVLVSGCASTFFPGGWVLLWIPPAMGALVFIASRRQWRWLAAFAVVNPLTATVVTAAGEYFCGTGRLNFHGLPAMEAFNIDRATRLNKHSGGCMLDGSEWLSDTVHNEVLRDCTAAFGRMRGTPSGYYPAEEDILAGWDGEGEPISLGDLQRGDFILGGQPRHIDDVDGMFFFMLRQSSLFGYSVKWQDEKVKPKIQGKVIRGDVFAIRLTCPDPGGNAVRYVDRIALFGGAPQARLGCFEGPSSPSRLRLAQ